MTNEHPQIHVAAFRLKDQFALRYDGYLIHLPAAWRDAIARIHQTAKRKSNGSHNPRTDSLTKAIRALIPGVIAIRSTRDWWGNGLPWLYFDDAINTQQVAEALTWITQSWLRVEYGQDSEALNLNDIAWHKGVIGNLTETQLTPAGTAHLPHIDAFYLLPHVLAAVICKSNDRPIELKGQPLRFYRAPREPGTSGAELISWPPYQHKEKSFFSRYIQLEVQTVPFQSYPLIHCKVGVRRWDQPYNAHNSHITLAGKRSETSVYIRTQSWLSNPNLSENFQVSGLRWVKTDNGFAVVWADHVLDILADLAPKHNPFPDATLLCKEAQRFITAPDTQFAIAYRERKNDGFGHSVKAGVMPYERRLIVEQVAERFADYGIELEKPYQRVSLKPKMVRAKNPFVINAPKSGGSDRERAADAAAQRECCVAIRECFGKDVPIELWCRDASMADRLQDAMTHILGSDLGEQHGLAVNVSRRQLESWAGDLNVHNDSNIGPATEARAKEIADKIAKAQQTTLAFVELNNTRGEIADPKQAIRMGFAQSGRLTQFITPEREDDETITHRAYCAVLDGLRQLGVSLQLPSLHKNFHKPLELIGAWVINIKNRMCTPVITSLRMDNSSVQALVPGANQWQPYPQALLELSQAGSTRNLAKDDAGRWLMQTLRRELKQRGDTVLFCEAINLRNTWQWLQNKHLMRDSIQLNGSSAESITEWSKLRVVRVRVSNEMPQWYVPYQSKRQDGTGSSDSATWSTGVFRVSELDRVFVSTVDRPASQVGGRAPKKDALKHENVGFAFNPQLLEIAVPCLQQGDEPVSFACLTHVLRRAAIQFEDGLALPLPLHLAGQMREYVPKYQLDDDETN